MRCPNQIVEAGLLEVVDLAERYVPDVLAAALKEAMRILSGVEAIRFIFFDHRDVVRHPIVQAIVNAYDTFEGGKPAPDVLGRVRAASEEA